jgi:hypothetical protein
MTKLAIYIVALGAVFNCAFWLLASGCGSNGEEPTGHMSAPRRVTLTWTNYNPGEDSPSTAVYILNGSVVGQGEEGFERVLDAIEKLPLRSEIVVFPARFVTPQYQLRPSGPITVGPMYVPFLEDEDLCQKMSDAWASIKATVTYCYPYPDKAKWKNVHTYDHDGPMGSSIRIE